MVVVRELQEFVALLCRQRGAVAVARLPRFVAAPAAAGALPVVAAKATEPLPAAAVPLQG